ncbi:hypothetical protein BGCPKDLD_4670 [Methylorubrum suomiense]|uniref:Uncharacterized protein n=1 Tax=Methylorubrum suomiense TaxID=144191 RepID=A0ABQ4V1V6_9HYPH|nr:hypothetical protein BGCPKDLD_4670 [Methylorubrum suomiense]
MTSQQQADRLLALHQAEREARRQAQAAAERNRLPCLRVAA